MTKYHTATVAGLNDYLTARGLDIPGTVDSDAQEAALLVASEWIDGTYGKLFSGFQTGGFLQDREWPRTGAVTNTDQPYTFPTDAIPDRVTNAVYEAAFRQIIAPGSLLVDYTPNKYKSVSVDGAVSVEYAGFSSAAQVQKTYPAIDRLLEPLFDTSANGSFSIASGPVTRV